jgi:hypothetical protein
LTAKSEYKTLRSLVRGVQSRIIERVAKGEVNKMNTKERKEMEKRKRN